MKTISLKGVLNENGWRYAGEDGQLVCPICDTNLTLEPGEFLHFTTAGHVYTVAQSGHKTFEPDPEPDGVNRTSIHIIFRCQNNHILHINLAQNGSEAESATISMIHFPGE